MEKLLIRNATILDGSGNEPFTGDVLISGGVIAAVGAVAAPEDCGITDAAGRCLAPGFVDIHRHADLQAFSPAFGAAELAQGITTCVSGNCGMSAAPCPPGLESALYGYLEPCLGNPPEGAGFPTFADYAESFSGRALKLNMGAYVGSGTVRIAVKGFDPGALSPAEMKRARTYVAEAMHSGALGLSMGLMYAPECNYQEDELVLLAREAGKHGGLLAVHIRGEGASLPASVGEAIRVAQRADVRLQISHFKAAGRGNWGGTLTRAIELIEAARARGQDVCCDAYPYAAGATMLVTLLPPSFLAGGMAQALQSLQNPVTRGRLRTELQRPHADWDNLVLDLGWEAAVASSLNRPDNAPFIGRSIAQIAAMTGRDEADCLCDILVSEEGRAGMVLHSMSPADVERVLALPWCCVASDAIYPPAGNPHPRLFGAFPRVIREYVLEKHTLTLQEAVRKMTSQPAARVGLKDKGLIRQGYDADLILFQPERVRDTATYADPRQLAEGMDLVLVGGRVAVQDDAMPCQGLGAFLKREATS